MIIELRCHILFVLFISQTILDISQAFPLIQGGTKSKDSPTQAICARKTGLVKPNGTISSYRTSHDQDISCSWVIHAARGHHVKLAFLDFDVTDNCSGICVCSYLMIKESTDDISWKYCNERQLSGTYVTKANKVRIHLRLKSGSKSTNDGFTIWYTTQKNNAPSHIRPEVDTRSIIPTEKIRHLGIVEEKLHSESDQGYSRLKKMSPTSKKIVMTTVVPRDLNEEETGPSKMTVLLGVAIPVVMIFILVVILIGYYNYLEEIKQQQASESPNSGTHIGDMILNTGAALAPMVNLKKARRESSRRREKANQLYDDMLLSWKQTNECRKERLLAKQESVNVWESYQASKKHRRSSSRDATKDSKAFAMLVSNAINAPEDEVEQETFEEEPEKQEKPRPSSILITRNPSDDIPHKRNSKVLSWNDLSTKSKEENISEKRSNSASEIVIPVVKEPKPTGSSHIPAIVVSQPSFESEESEANETDRLIKDNRKEDKSTEAEKSEPTGAKPTYSCSEHVKDILRESYGDELEQWWQKPNKSASQGSLKDSSDSKVKYTAMKGDEEEID